MIERLKSLHRVDWLVICAFVCFVLVHVFTQYYISANQSAAVTVAQSEAVVKASEANDFAEWQFRLANYGFIFKFVLFPAIYFSAYILARRKYGVDALESTVLMICMMAVLNVMNDLGAVLGVMARPKVALR